LSSCWRKGEGNEFRSPRLWGKENIREKIEAELTKKREKTGACALAKKQPPIFPVNGGGLPQGGGRLGRIRYRIKKREKGENSVKGGKKREVALVKGEEREESPTVVFQLVCHQ